MFYEPQFIRKLKLCKISGSPITLPSKVSGICLFEQDWKNRWFYYKYNEVYQFLYENYTSNYSEINIFIKDRLKEADKMSVLIPALNIDLMPVRLKEADKMSVLIPFVGNTHTEARLKEADKMSVLIPINCSTVLHTQLNEADKMSVLTPSLDFSSPELKDARPILAHLLERLISN
jgi:hypothetical protein